MIIQRRAISEIQMELKIISQKCHFQKDWTDICIQFFSKNEEKIPHIPFSYREFSLGLLYYTIRNHDKSINREYYLYSVISKIGSRQKKVFKIYRDLCEKFSAPSDQIDYNTMWKNIGNYLQQNYNYEIDYKEFQRLIKKYPAKKFSQMRGLKILFNRAQELPKRYSEKEIENFIKISFSEMQLL